MKAANIFALTSFFASIATAAPLMHKRALDVVTKYVEAVETVVVYTTVWVPANTNHAAPTTTAEAVPTTSSTEEVPVPETTSTTSTYVPPPEPTTSTTEAPAEPTTTYVPPEPSTTETPTTTQEPQTTTQSVPESTPTEQAAGSTSDQSSTYTGDLTWYETGQGACGWTNGANDKIVAISESMFDEHMVDGNPNNNPLCGKTVTITYGGKTSTAKVVDRCTGCAYGDLDLSQGFFNEITSNGDGRVHGAKWSFV